ncbi:acetylornithine deacetylase [Tenacibaculum sp. IB213877]|uniref:acetylornithine deacetylase n=1 Tax=Tenacibaculum sp. IB213877 TaxID=3097351 RepID=UPI002A5A9FBF|nr:acetylornithine deacetylase [Tenacibaculum sp. IB213877]MDY0779648.1 acetylornithine deacetylase [Tenacibaculum sp. IB213877]
MTEKEILAKLVSFEILSKESNLPIIDWISTYIKSHGVDTVYVYSQDKNQASLHCRIGPSVDGGVILSGHTDVVPAKGQPWKTNPFELVEKDGKLYGRGACDMKGFLACFLSVLPKMVKANLKKPIYFAFSYDEEIGCISAPELVRNILNFYPEKPKYAIIGEPSMMQPIVGQKGILDVLTEVNGSEGHSSGIHKEVSAIHESARLVLWLENKMKSLANSIINKHFSPPYSTIHVGKFNGGIATNVVANKVTLEWEIRSIPQYTTTAILSEFEDYCRELEKEKQQLFPDFKIKNTKLHPPVPCLETNINESIVELIFEVSGNTSVSYVSYATEAGQFAEVGLESVICGPGSIEQAHRANEYISVAQMKLGVEMIEKIVYKLSV